MNKFFKDIRHGDIEAVRAAISQNSDVVNEVYNAKTPKKDIGQSPLQVALKCGEFEIIELLIDSGADCDFMEDPALIPPHSVCIPVLQDAISYTFDALMYRQCSTSEKYIPVIKKLLENGADPNRISGANILPMGMAVLSAEQILEHRSLYPNVQEIAKKSLFEILDLLIQYGADKEEWFEQEFWGTGISNRFHFMEERDIEEDGIDRVEHIRNALEEYFNRA